MAGFEFFGLAFRRCGAHRLVPMSVLLLAGCAAFGPAWETPTVTVSSFRALPSGGALPEFEIGLEVVNPNRTALQLAGAAYTISLDGREIIKGVGNDLPVIDGYGTGRVTLTASANLLAGIQLFTDLLRSPRESFEYRLEAKLDPGGWRPAIRVSDTGRISADALAR
jgi:LEA14-like dessication related protein